MAASRSLAFDLARARTYDRDGRLRVTATNISKSNVCEYGGWEIPGADTLGLDPSRTYKLWRHPDELACAAGTFNNVPLLTRHVPAHADDHKPNDVCGATGSDAEFVAPYLRNSIVIWARQAINGVEDRSRCELSCGYFYKPEMRSGRTPQGEAFDGVMRDICGSHLALVERGRAGPDVLVADCVGPGGAPAPITDMFPNWFRLTPR